MLHDYHNHVYYSDYCFVDCAFGGVNHRNNVMSIQDIAKFQPITLTDCYSTYFRYTSDYQQFFNKNSCVKGYVGLCFADYLWYDFDGGKERNYNDAHKSAKDFVLTLQNTFDVEPNSLKLYCSGRGFHIGLPFELFGWSPSSHLPDILKRLTAKIISSGYDDSIYKHNALWRMPLTLNSKNGRWKMQLTAQTFFTKPDEIISQSINVSELDKNHWNPNDEWPVVRNSALESLYLQAQAEMEQFEKQNRNPRSNSTSFFFSEPQCVRRILFEGVEKGDRRPASLRIAGYLKKIGLHEDFALSVINAWDKRNNPPRANNELIVYDRVVKEVYSSTKIDYGCKDSEIKAKYCCKQYCPIYKGYAELPEIKKLFEPIMVQLDNSPYIQTLKEAIMEAKDSNEKLPIRKYTATHNMSLAVFEKQVETSKMGVFRRFKTFALQKSFFNEKKKAWENPVIYLNEDELLLAESLICKAKEECIIQIQ